MIAKEFPCGWQSAGTSHNSKCFDGNPERFQRYWEAAKVERGVTFVGRLATYKYLDMDDVVAQVMVKLGESAVWLA